MSPADNAAPKERPRQTTGLAALRPADAEPSPKAAKPAPAVTATATPEPQAGAAPASRERPTTRARRAVTTDNAKSPPTGPEQASVDNAKSLPARPEQARPEQASVTTDAAAAAGSDVAAPARSEKPAAEKPTAEKPAASERRRSREARGYAARQQQQSRRKLARTQDDDRDAERDFRRPVGREFVDQNGVRSLILPRRWSERDDDAGYGGPFRSRRVIVVRPSGFFDDDD